MARENRKHRGAPGDIRFVPYDPNQKTERSWKWRWWVGGGLALLVLLVGGLWGLRHREPPPPVPEAPVPAAVVTVTNVATAASEEPAVPDLPFSSASGTATGEEAESTACHGRVRILANAPDYARAFLSNTAKRVRFDTNHWITVQTLPHIVTNAVCGDMDVWLEADGFKADAPFRCTVIQEGRTSDVAFLLTPLPATLLLACDEKDAVAQIGNVRFPVTNVFSVASLQPVRVTITGAGSPAQVLDLGPYEPLTTNRHIVAFKRAVETVPSPVEASSADPLTVPLSTNHKPGETTTVDVGAGVKLDMVWIPPGNFLMGSPESEEGRFAYEIQHRVTISKGFWMSKYEVTQELWQRVMSANSSRFKDRGLSAPVEQVSWNDSQTFLAKLNEMAKTKSIINADSGARLIFRLPTEAEWEYACRAGSTTRFNTGGSDSDLDRAAWYGKNSRGVTYSVGKKTPNAWGLYDMHGNVWEWCADRLRRYTTSEVSDPLGIAEKEGRAIRGGGWNSSSARELRSARRLYDEPFFLMNISVGIRLVMSDSDTQDTNKGGLEQ